MPLFPELRKPLLELFSQMPEGSEYVITRYRGTNANLRTQFERILTRAGVSPWPRLFQNLRSTRANELCRIHPSHVAAAWLGHSEEVADEHYRNVTDADFDKAIAGASNQAAQNQAQHTPETSRIELKPDLAMGENHSEKQAKRDLCEAAGGESMGPTRFELVTSSLSGTRSNQLSYEPALFRGKRFYGTSNPCQIYRPIRLTRTPLLGMMELLSGGLWRFFPL